MLLIPSYENQISRQEPSYEPAWVWGPQLAIHYCDACDRRKDQLGVAGGGRGATGAGPAAAREVPGEASRFFRGGGEWDMHPLLAGNARSIVHIFPMCQLVQTEARTEL